MFRTYEFESQNGTISFGDIVQQTTVTKTIQFAKPFISIPNVIASANATDAPMATSTLVVTIKDISISGFTVSIKNDQPSNGYYAKGVILEWLASVE